MKVEIMTNRPQIRQSLTATTMLERINTATTMSDLTIVFAEARRKRGELTCIEAYDIEARISARRKELLAK